MIAASFGLSVFLLLNAIQSDIALPIATDGEVSGQQQLPELQKSQQIDELPLQKQQQQPQQSVSNLFFTSRTPAVKV